jgi:hypothetical protein
MNDYFISVYILFKLIIVKQKLSGFEREIYQIIK